MAARLRRRRRGDRAAFRQPLPIPTGCRSREPALPRAAVRQLDRLIYGFIAERRAERDDRGDLLSMLLAARDEDGSRMSDQQLRDEALTLFVAGHETTALALTYALYLLAAIPSSRSISAPSCGRCWPAATPSFADLPSA